MNALTSKSSRLVARGGALDNPAPRSARGMRVRKGLVAAEAATPKCSRGARFYRGRLRGRISVGTSQPRAKRGAGLSSAPSRAAVLSSVIRHPTPDTRVPKS